MIMTSTAAWVASTLHGRNHNIGKDGSIFSKGQSMSTVIKQSKKFDASKDRVYKTIADSTEHSAFTGAPAKLSNEPGEAFTTHGGAIEGRMLEIIPNELIVQAWRVATWPKGVYSIVSYAFTGDSTSAEITLTHSGLPEEEVDHIDQGWHNMYWEPMTKYFAAIGGNA